MKKLIFLFATLLLVAGFITAQAPVISTTQTGAITGTSARTGGVITSSGSSAIKARGVCWSTAVNPTVKLTTKTNNGTGTGAFASQITGLVAGKTYHVRSYATNTTDTAYGADSSFLAVDIIPIGSQQWMAKNLDVAYYRNGDVIPRVTNPDAMTNLTTGAWCYVYNDSIAGTKFGKLYNWYAVTDPRGLAPKGWHVASQSEWSNLANLLSVRTGATWDVAGAKMKQAGIEYWSVNENNRTYDLEGNNSSGWNGLPGGAVIQTTGVSRAAFEQPGPIAGSAGYYGHWWTPTESGGYGVSYLLTYSTAKLQELPYMKPCAFSVRCIRDYPVPDVPTVITTVPTGISCTSANSGGNIKAGGISAVTARGVCVGFNPNPTVAGTKTVDSSGQGSFSSIYTGIPAGSKTYMRAYATINAVTYYGAQVCFKTNGVPAVTTTQPTQSTDTSMAISGGIIAFNLATITTRGVCWSTLVNPTTALTTKTTGGSGYGTYTSNMNGLVTGTTYHARAYATNACGTSYGNDLTYIPVRTNLTIGQAYMGGKLAYIYQQGVDPGFVVGQIHGLIATSADQGQLALASANLACDTLVVNTFTDWRLPTKDELNKLYLNKVAIGGFSADWYWNSLQWIQNFGTGQQAGPQLAGSALRFRAVRTF